MNKLMRSKLFLSFKLVSLLLLEILVFVMLLCEYALPEYIFQFFVLTFLIDLIFYMQITRHHVRTGTLGPGGDFNLVCSNQNLSED
jgi:hypothetical protein